MTFARSTPLMLLLLAAAACGDEAPPPATPEQVAQRVAVYRQACAATKVETGAEQDLATIDATLAMMDSSNPASAISRQATQAALEFARAIHRHSQLRATAYAYLDSAVNHATTTADSARFVDRAATFSIQAPEVGTVEANVIAEYQKRLNAILENPDDPCNWDVPI